MNNRTRPVSAESVRVRDPFWSPRLRLLRETILPYQWQALNDHVPGAARSGCIQNFRIAAGEVAGEYYGYPFQDTDLYKWLEAVGHYLAVQRDPALEELADQAIDLIARAQQPDGYLNTYYTVKEPGRRWTNLMHNHELYNAGHFFEAAVAYYQATGKRRVLDVACRFADHIATVFGRGPGQLRGYDGHPEVELALVKLYRATGERRYLELARFFVDERGQEPSFFAQECAARGTTLAEQWAPLEYYQADRPVREQKDAVGHAVRAMYLYTAMADLAGEKGDESLAEACQVLWRSVTQRRMYVTGGIGSSAHGEAFTVDYDLPADLAYAETCAAIGLVFFAHRMLQLDPRAEYADVLERALYNGVLSGISLDGQAYFYVNPLEVWPEACHHRHDKRHVKTVRQKWFGCACCPPNVARLLASLNQYLYTHTSEAIYVHLYIGSEAEVEVAGTRVRLVQASRLPWEGEVEFQVAVERPASFTLALRVPNWCRAPSLRVNGQPVDLAVAGGYALVRRVWSDGDTVTWSLPMAVERVYATPEVRACAGKVALQRGPLVYCLEEVDNGPVLTDIVLPAAAPIAAVHDPDLLGGVTILTAQGLRSAPAALGGPLYRTERPPLVPTTIKAIPYYAWCNRTPGEMLVWIRES